MGREAQAVGKQQHPGCRTSTEALGDRGRLGEPHQGGGKEGQGHPHTSQCQDST